MGHNGIHLVYVEDARNEYQNYTPQIFALKINGSDLDTITDHLFQNETKTMGISGNREHCKEIARAIYNIQA